MAHSHHKMSKCVERIGKQLITQRCSGVQLRSMHIHVIKGQFLLRNKMIDCVNEYGVAKIFWELTRNSLQDLIILYFLIISSSNIL